jgi:hypothetical protein
MPSGFTPVVIDLRPSMKVTIPWGKPRGIRCMPSGFMPVVIDLRPSMEVTIPWGKPRGIQCMPSGFMPVVIDLRPSMKVTIPWGKPRGIQWPMPIALKAVKHTFLLGWPSHFDALRARGPIVGAVNNRSNDAPPAAVDWDQNVHREIPRLNGLFRLQ